nr:hypothetical protein [Tanacetum cinerariifolium]
MGVEFRQIHLCVIFVRASSVEIFLLKELVRNAILGLGIHSFMIQTQSLSMKFKAFLIHLHNPITIYTCVRYVKAIPTMVMNVRNGSRLSMSRNHAIIKTLVIMLICMTQQESDEFIKSSDENLVPNLSESKDLSDGKCDVPACGDFTTFFNLLFDADDDFSSSDDKTFSDEDILKEIYSNPLFDEEIISIKIDPHHFNVESDLIESLLNQDSLIISSLKIDSLLDEFVGELILIKTIPSGIDETDCDPEEEIQINLTLTPDDSMSPGIENDDYDSEGDILEELLSNDSLLLSENESFDIDIPSSPRPPTKPPDDDEIMPRLFPTQPTPASNQEKSPYLLSHRGLKAF